MSAFDQAVWSPTVEVDVTPQTASQPNFVGPSAFAAGAAAMGATARADTPGVDGAYSIVTPRALGLANALHRLGAADPDLIPGRPNSVGSLLASRPRPGTAPGIDRPLQGWESSDQGLHALEGLAGAEGLGSHAVGAWTRPEGVSSRRTALL